MKCSIVFGQRARQIREHPNLSVLLGLLCVVAIGYAPAINAYFISDDYWQLSYLFFNTQEVLQGNQLREWFLGFIDAYVYFRPVTYAFTLVDFVAWGVQPQGYHVTRFILHWLASFVVYLIAWQMLRRRLTAAIVSILFAILPIHATAVSWLAATTDVVCGFWSLTSFLFFVLYRNQPKARYYFLALIFFILALSAKEVGLVLPGAFVIYDVVMNYRAVLRIDLLVRRYLPIALIIGAYFAFRLGVMGTFGYSGQAISRASLEYWLNGTFRMIAYPFVPDLTSELRMLMVIALMAGILIGQPRRIALFGVAWIFLMFLPTVYSATGVSGRSFYIPSFGLTLVLGMLLTQWINQGQVVVRSIGMVTLLIVTAVLGQAVWATNQSLDKAGQIALAIQTQVKQYHPILPSDARLVFTGVPDETPEGVLVYIGGLGDALKILYRNPKLQTYDLTKFPIWLDNLERTYFFQVDHRRVAERADLIDALKARQACEDFRTPAIVWDFSSDLHGWEAWSELDDLVIRDRALFTRSHGNDPFMASPAFDVASIGVGQVQIEMRVRADAPTARGELYWQVEGQADFFPGLHIEFPVVTDNQFHIYPLDLGKTGRLAIGDRIVRLRLDPVNLPAEIEIASIQVFSHCSIVQGNHCLCVR